MRPAEALRIAVVGAGVSGLVAAYLLARRHQVTLYEAADRLGGHANTLDLELPDGRAPVDAGFIVYNQRNYPHFTALLAELGVATTASDMSFSVSVGDGALEWAGSSLSTLFGQRRNLARPGFHRMWADILRFQRHAVRDLQAGALAGVAMGDYLAAGRYGDSFRQHYLLPMAAAIWSAPFSELLGFPAQSFVRFFVNHGLLSLADRPQWRTILGGSRQYVARLAAASRAQLRTGCPVRAVRRSDDGVVVASAAGEAQFDHVVLATHADAALGLLADADPEQRRILGAFRFQRNRAVVHRDATLMPRRRRVWASWNYLAGAAQEAEARVSVSYWMNRLQPLSTGTDVFVSLNPLREPRPDLVLGDCDYDHPMFDAAAIAAQRDLPGLQGRGGLWHCGAWSGYGFHEDGAASAVAVATVLGAPPAWAAEHRAAA